MGYFKDIFYTPEGIYSFSNYYFGCGISVANDFHKKAKGTHGEYPYLIPIASVCVTNLSLALELALKGLHLYQFNEVPEKTHSLLSLFNKLPQKIKEEIAKKPQHRKYDNYLITVIGDERILNNKVTFKSGGMNEILANLKAHDKSFINFRYLYEQEAPKSIHCNFNFMANFTHNTLKVLQEKIITPDT